jgi:hypothetical protein
MDIREKARLHHEKLMREDPKYREEWEKINAVMTDKLTTRADLIRPGDKINGRKVIWSIPNYLREGKTEVKFEDGLTEFFNNGQMIAVARS